MTLLQSLIILRRPSALLCQLYQHTEHIVRVVRRNRWTQIRNSVRQCRVKKGRKNITTTLVAKVEIIIIIKGLRENLEAIPGKHSIDWLQKTAILGTSHKIGKELQSETWILSGGDHRWFNRSTRVTRSVTRDNTTTTTNTTNNNNNHISLCNLSRQKCDEKRSREDSKI